MIKIICLFSLYFFVQMPIWASSCTTLDAVSWLTGDWYYKNTKVEISESWQKISSHTMEGNGQTKSKKTNKIISAETLRLVAMSGNVFYIAKVASNKLPIAFKLTYCSNNVATFENPTHDFPQKLVYKFINKNNINVIVSGAKNKGFEIKYHRKKPN